MPTIQELYAQINWVQSWFDSLNVPLLTHFEADTVYQGLVNQVKKNPIISQQGHRITFVPQAALPENTAYESFIADTGKIPTRDNLHDLLNGIIWLNFPKTKAVLNHLHTLDIAQNGIAPHRSPLRNALTLFDENGGVVVSSEVETLTQLQAFDWENALFENRRKWLKSEQTVQFFPFGHALLEKLISPRKNITSHVLLLQIQPDFFTFSINEQREKLDSILAALFLADFEDLLQSKNFQPLPVMGIPNFCAENQQREFYQDKAVFREANGKKALILQI